jgi:LPS sulfotransferase NodH
MKTQRLLAIASVERTGSTLLCSILRGTQAAGAPEEYLNIQTKNFAKLRRSTQSPKLRPSRFAIGLVRRLSGRYPWKDITSFSPSSFHRYLFAIASERTTSNGVFGVKMHWSQYKRHMLDLGFDVTVWGAPVSWLRITREDEIRQAISFVRAAQSESWNSNMQAVREPTYDATAILAALARIEDENRDWSAYFAANKIQPLHITYEQLTRNMDSTIRSVMAHIGVSIDSVPEPQTKKQSDSSSKEWALRFSSEHPEHAHRANMGKTEQ